MAYAATITIKRVTVSGRRHYLVTMTETEAGTATETQIKDNVAAAGDAVSLPLIGTVVMVKSTLTAGTGTTIDPEIGEAASWTANTQDEVWVNGTAAAHIHDHTNNRHFTNGTLYWRAKVDAAADNSVSTTLLIVEGHVPL